VLSQQIQINEIAYEEWFMPDDDYDWGSGWIELKNNSDVSVTTSNWYLKLNNNEPWALPSLELNANAHLFIWLSGKNRNEDQNNLHASFTIIQDYNKFKLYDSSSNTIIDSLTITNQPYWNESRSRFPENGTTWYNSKNKTPGELNAVFGPWRRVATFTNFTPRDSAPNAALFFDNKHWIFEGWEGGGGEEAAKSNIWASSDAADWKLINPTPPYHPYSAYIVFDNHLWAFENKAFRSADGIEWEMVSDDIPFGTNARVVEFNGSLFALKGSKIYRSNDGMSWTEVVDETPWGYREFPAFVSFKNKLWVYGGGINYFTGEDKYFNDVWSSDDGIHWETVVHEAEWSGRLWPGFTTFDNKMWLVGGWNYYNKGDTYYGNRNDTWYSENGIDWHQISSSNIWMPRHAAFTWSSPDGIFLSAGFLNNYGLFNDVWKLEAIDSWEPNVFYLKPDQKPQKLTSWGTNSDGSGLSPTGFQFDAQKFIVTNTDSMELINDWSISANSKIVYGNGQYPIYIEHKKGIDVSGPVELNKFATLALGGNQTSPKIIKTLEPSLIMSGDNVRLSASEIDELEIYGSNTILLESTNVKNSVTLIENGSISNTPFTLKYLPDATLEYRNVGNRAISNAELPFDFPASKVILDCQCELALEGDREIDSLFFLNGRLLMKNGTLTASGISGFDSTKYIVTENAFLSLPINSITGRVFPVGLSSSFNPVELKMLKTHQPGHHVNVSNFRLDTLRLQEHSLNVGWEISSNFRSPSYEISLGFNKKDEGQEIKTNTLHPFILDNYGHWNLIEKSAVHRSGSRKVLKTRIDSHGIFSISDLQNSSINHTRVFPNPIKDDFDVTFSNAPREAFELSILDLSGRIVQSQIYEGGRSHYSVNVALNVTPGVYLLKIEADKTSYRKIIISK
jgi:hypothetical protein